MGRGVREARSRGALNRPGRTCLLIFAPSRAFTRAARNTLRLIGTPCAPWKMRPSGDGG